MILRRAVDASIRSHNHGIRVDCSKGRVTVTDYGDAAVLREFLQELRHLHEVYTGLMKPRKKIEKEIERRRALCNLKGKRGAAEKAVDELKAALQELPVPVPLLAKIKELHFKSGIPLSSDMSRFRIVSLHFDQLRRILKKCPNLEFLHLEHVRIFRREEDILPWQTFPSVKKLRLTYDDLTLVPEFPGLLSMFPGLCDCQVDGGYFPPLAIHKDLTLNLEYGSLPLIPPLTLIKAPMPSHYPYLEPPCTLPLERLTLKSNEVALYIVEGLLIAGSLGKLKSLQVALLNGEMMLLVARVIDACTSTLEEITLDMRPKAFQRLMVGEYPPASQRLSSLIPPSELDLRGALERFDALTAAIASCSLLQSFSCITPVRADYNLTGRIPKYILLFFTKVTFEDCPRLTRLNLDLHIESPATIHIFKESVWQKMQAMMVNQASHITDEYRQAKSTGRPWPPRQINRGPFEHIQVNFDMSNLSRQTQNHLKKELKSVMDIWHDADILRIGTIVSQRFLQRMRCLLTLQFPQPRLDLLLRNYTRPNCYK